MKRHLILLTVLSLFIFSCKTESKKETINSNSENENSEVIQDTTLTVENSSIETNAITFDWSKSQLLKQDLLAELEQNNLPHDRLLVNYLNSYSKLVSEFNDILFDLDNYDSLNTLIYLNKEKIYQCAINFKEKVESSGLSIASSEGMIYLEKNTSFIKSEVLEQLDSVSAEFLNLYCLEIDTVCCTDGGLIISEEELVNRVLNWGNLLDKVSGLKYHKIVNSEFYSNLALLYWGQDNTPAFDRVSGKYNQVSFDLMQNIIKQFPNSIVAKEFNEYSELIVKENFERTDNVNEFLDNKFK